MAVCLSFRRHRNPDIIDQPHVARLDSDKATDITGGGPVLYGLKGYFIGKLNVFHFKQFGLIEGCANVLFELVRRVSAGSFRRIQQCLKDEGSCLAMIGSESDIT